MGKIKEYKTSLGAFIQSDKGQRFFNFAYSIGAAIVIWGALFKILHLPGGNFLLSLGMGTEVLMFTLTAFDRPPKQYKWEQVFPVFETGKDEDRPDFEHGGGVVVNGGGAPAAAHAGAPAQAPLVSPDLSGASPAEMMAGITSASQLYVDQLTEMTRELRHLQESTRALNTVSDVLLESYRAITENSENITRSSNGYVEQMQDLNRNINGLNTIYEIQLKSVSSQLDAIDRVNRGIKDISQMYEQSSDASSRYCAETEKMARYMQQLNSVYEKMITAMTINMYNPMAAAAAAAAPQAQP
ncbi:MAG: gliding motility protein GldL, partial [[Clostridium] fimetarium]|nr:gliding motility protein GldL [[Clostridium] fimetarium]